jgi:ketosteroid isomerase-like protein
MRMGTEESLLETCKEWDSAMVRNDADEIGAFMTSDWVIVGPNEGMMERSKFLEAVRSGSLVHTRMDSDDMRVKTYGDTGVVIARGTSAGTFKGGPFELYEWSQSVFIYLSERWLCISTMLAPAQREGK